MAAIPEWMLPHTVTVEPLTGNGAYGPVFGQGVEVSVSRSVQAADRVEDGGKHTTVYEGTLVAVPDKAGLFPVGSRVTLWPGALGFVRDVHLNIDGDQGIWEHTEVTIG